MNDWNDETSRASISRIVEKLRSPFHLDDTFDVRVMSAVHAEALAQCDERHAAQRASIESRDPWWHRRYTIRFSALGGLAIAASVAAVMLVGAAAIARLQPANASPAAARVAVSSTATLPPVQNVHFILVDGSANQVWLTGDFNSWSRKEIPLVRAANGSAWTVSVPLPAGRHEYAYIVADQNGEHWMADPLTPVRKDEFGTESSIVSVSANSVTSTM